MARCAEQRARDRRNQYVPAQCIDPDRRGWNHVDQLFRARAVSGGQASLEVLTGGDRGVGASSHHDHQLRRGAAVLQPPGHAASTLVIGAHVPRHHAIQHILARRRQHHHRVLDHGRVVFPGSTHLYTRWRPTRGDAGVHLELKR